MYMCISTCTHIYIYTDMIMYTHYTCIYVDRCEHTCRLRKLLGDVPTPPQVTVVAPGAGTGLNGKVYEELSPSPRRRLPSWELPRRVWGSSGDDVYIYIYMYVYVCIYAYNMHIHGLGIQIHIHI